MSAVVAALCASGAVLAAAHRLERPARLRATIPRGGSAGPSDVLRRAGRACRGALGLRPDPRLDRRAGYGVGLVVVAAVAGPQLAVVAGAAAALRSRWCRIRSGARVGRREIERDLPDLVDLLTLVVGAGLPVAGALPVIAPVAPTGLRADLRAVVDAVAAGRPTDEALAGLADAWGAPARPLVHVLADHLRYGTPALPGLERVAVEARAARRRAAETRARRLPVLLLFPLVLCTLPAFGLLTVAPLVAGTFDSLRGGHLEAPASLGP